MAGEKLVGVHRNQAGEILIFSLCEGIHFLWNSVTRG